MVLFSLLVLAVFLSSASAGHNKPVLVSQANGVGADGASLDPSISANGRYVAFHSDADILSVDDNNNVGNVFVRDLQANANTLVSQANGVGANGTPVSASISADGRYVAFHSDADNLSADDLNSVTNVFVRDLQANTTTLVNYGIGGAGADGSSFDPSISADGRYVAFHSSADNLSADDDNGFINVFVRDLQANTTMLASHGSGVAANDHSSEPSISADGRYVAFSSNADNLSTDDDNTFRNVFRQDVALAFGAKTLVTLNLAARRIPARGPLKVRVKNDNGFAVSGKLSGRTTKGNSGNQRIKLKAKAFGVGPTAKATVKLSLPKALRRELGREGKFSLRLTAKVKDPAEHTRSVKKRVTAKLRR